MFLDLDEHPGKVEGVGQLLFEMCKGVRNMFHSCTEKVNNQEEHPGSMWKGIQKTIDKRFTQMTQQEDCLEEIKKTLNGEH